MGFKVARCFLIPFVPLTVIAVAPVHSDSIEPFDLFVRQLSFRVRPLLACDPPSQPFTSRCHIGARDIQVSVLCVVDS